MEIRAIEITGNSVGDAPMRSERLSQISEYERMASVSADGVIERRRTTVWTISAGVLDHDWSGVRCLIRVQRQTQLFDTGLQNWRERSDTTWAISTRRVTAEDAAQAIRDHWLIENALHHVRDVALGEDASRVRKQPGVFAQLRTWALNLLRVAGYENIKAARQTLGWSPEALLRLCSG
ncbi:ISAs1 family transposase [Crenobacter cavernae]|uniref:ISAs1 family transposase n=1 Tax=Crenobacter cavernae TaxID=2290923 RepID=A0A345Y9D0_9NEIS|nr:ISAs1 family transposase [Crenobacter cavernae]